MSSTPPYIHPGSVLRPAHKRTTSRCETVLRELLAKDTDRLAHRPTASAEPTTHNNHSINHWIAHTHSSMQSQSALSSGSSLARSKSVSSKPTHLASTTNLSHSHNVPLSPSLATPEPPTQSSSHLGHRLRHQSLTVPPLAFQPPPPLTPSLLDHHRPLPGHPTQPQPHAQIMSVASTHTCRSPPALSGAPTQLHQPPSPPIQYPATAAILRGDHPSNHTQDSHPRPSPHLPRKRSASLVNIEHSPILQHPRARPHPADMTDWTMAESPDDESSPSLTPPTASSRNPSFSGSIERAFTSPCTPPSFNIKVANEVCRSIQGYVSFFEVEGLGRPLAEIEEERLERERLEKEQRAKRSWLAWFSNGVFRTSSTPSGA